jgi:hypothetical protein
MNTKFYLLSLLISALCLRAGAANYSLNWSTADGGGGTGTNGQYSISGTVGQPDASGVMTGGSYSLTSGFWSLISAVQTAGTPTLYISYSGNTVIIYWPDVSGWNLVQSGDLTTPIASWSASSSPTLANGTNYLNVVNPTGRQFYRLHKP